jgi:hypothetical protein
LRYDHPDAGGGFNPDHDGIPGQPLSTAAPMACAAPQGALFFQAVLGRAFHKGDLNVDPLNLGFK